MDIFLSEKITSFFDSLSEVVNSSQAVRAIVVTHLLEDRPYFLRALNKIAPIDIVFYKPKSVNFPTLDWSKNEYQIKRATRDTAALYEEISTIFSKNPESKYVFLDIGGYFSELLNEYGKNLSHRILGVVEDTENGLQKYLRLPNMNIPFYSVARSPLKDAEDYLVGHSTVFSAEALSRSMGLTFHGASALVIGFGKVGLAAADALRARGMHVAVYDHDISRMIFAKAMGYEIVADVDDSLWRFDFVCGATGSFSLQGASFNFIKTGAIIFTVTSSDDELDTKYLRDNFVSEKIDPNISKYSNSEILFYVLNHGQAVNFTHGAVVGPYIFLVQAEIIEATKNIIAGENNFNGSYSILSNESRTRISKKWLSSFSPEARKAEMQGN